MAEAKKYKHSTASPAHTRASAKYDKANTKQTILKLNIKTDADVIAHLDNLQESKRGYILRLIREDMKKGGQ